MRDTLGDTVVTLASLILIGSFLYPLSRRFPDALLPVFALSALLLIGRVCYLSRADGPVPPRELRKIDLEPALPWIADNIRGHDDVVRQVVRRIRSGAELALPDRPLGVFLLVGPTGTGKTYLAELIGRALYPDSEMLTLGMSQYKTPADVNTLLGAPPGQPGREVGGALTRPVLENPRRVILLDEIDKCHEDVRHCLYDALDAAQCREKSTGRVAHFNACVFFATANAGAEALAGTDRGLVAGTNAAAAAREALSRGGAFEKSFLARFSDILFMGPLPPLQVAEVACLQLANYWSRFGITVEYAAPEAIFEAMKRNTQFSEFGVREMWRLIQSYAEPMIQAARQRGITRVRLDVDPATSELTLR